MKKFLSFATLILLASSVMAQENPAKKKKPTIDPNRPNDHIMIQFGYTHWSGKPDSINSKSFSRSFNAYFLFDYPFKTNPHLSMAFGPGIGTDHMIFGSTYIGIKDNTSTIHFTNQSDTTHFKKTKLATAYLEAPIEFRYSAEPSTGKGMKFAVGVKVGTLINAHTRNAVLQDKGNSTLNDYTMKETSKKFFNKARLSGNLRIGYGHWSLYGSYQFTPVFKDGQGPVVKPFSVGITLSGL